MSLLDDVDLLLTCSPAIPCPREEACFRVAKYLRDILLDTVIRESLETVDDGEVSDYAPNWENRFVPCQIGRAHV
jgi:hypothetical protein